MSNFQRNVDTSFQNFTIQRDTKFKLNERRRKRGGGFRGLSTIKMVLKFGKITKSIDKGDRMYIC